jgi:hypothetical protein
MSTQFVQPLILPPAKPPAQFSTVAFSIISVVLTASAVITIWGSSSFPSNAPLEGIAAWASAGILYLGAVVTALLGMIQELFRKRYKEVVLRYAAVTGDIRYNPYINKTYTLWVVTSSSICLALPILIMLSSSIMDSLQKTIY